MSKNNNGSKGRHINTFWAITAVVVTALVAGGIIYFYANATELQDDLYSITFSSPIHVVKTPKKPVTSKTKKVVTEAKASTTPVK